MRETLRHLLDTGHIVEHPKGHYAALPARNEAEGRLTVNPRGYGFVATPAGDVYVAAADMHGAMHHDIVVIRLFQHPKGVGPAGEVLQVTERANVRMVGRFEKQGRLAIVTPTDRRIRSDVLVGRAGFGGATTGQIVVVRITQYPGPTTAAQGVVEEVLGLETDPGVDVEIVIREHDLRTVFPAAVEKAAHDDPREDGARSPRLASTSATCSPSRSTPSTRATSTTRSRSRRTRAAGGCGCTSRT